MWYASAVIKVGRDRGAKIPLDMLQALGMPEFCFFPFKFLLEKFFPCPPPEKGRKKQTAWKEMRDTLLLLSLFNSSIRQERKARPNCFAMTMMLLSGYATLGNLKGK